MPRAFRIPQVDRNAAMKCLQLGILSTSEVALLVGATRQAVYKWCEVDKLDSVAARERFARTVWALAQENSTHLIEGYREAFSQGLRGEEMDKVGEATATARGFGDKAFSPADLLRWSEEITKP